jgi:hypothetical protein
MTHYRISLRCIEQVRPCRFILRRVRRVRALRGSFETDTAIRVEIVTRQLPAKEAVHHVVKAVASRESLAGRGSSSECPEGEETIFPA